MNKRLVILLLLHLFIAGGLWSQIILPAKQRKDLLSGMERVINNTEAESASLEGVTPPFHVQDMSEPERESVVENSVTEDLPETLNEPSEILSDEDALRLIGRQFQPLGSLVMGDRRLLQLEEGRTIAVGESFKAKIKGRVYDVFIDEVSPSGYRLRLGNTMINKSFVKAGSTPNF